MTRHFLAPVCAAALGVLIGGISGRIERDKAPATGSGAQSSAIASLAGGRPANAFSARETALGDALSVLRGGHSLADLARLGVALDLLDPGQIPSLLDRLEVDESRSFDDRLAWLFSWWLQRDSVAAGAWIKPRLAAAAQDGPSSHFFTSSSRGRLLLAWAKADPQAAIGYARQHPRTGLAEELLRTAIMEWPDKSPGARLTILLDFPDTKARTAALDHLLGRWPRAELTAGLAAARTLPPGTTRDRLTATVLGRWAEDDSAAAFARYQALGLEDPRLLLKILDRTASRDPAQAVAWLEQLDAAQVARCGPTIVETWAESDPAAALAWALKNGVSLAMRFHPESRVIHSGLGRTTSGSFGSVNPLGAAMKKQPDATLAWIRTLPEGPERARFLEMATRQVADVDRALQLFAELPPDSAARVSSQSYQWFAADPEKGRQWAASLPPGPIRENAWRGLGMLPANVDLPPGSDRDAMLAGRVYRFGVTPTPEDRLATVREIGNPVLRRDMLDGVMEEESRRSPEQSKAAQEALAKSDFPEDWKRRWLAPAR